MKIATRRFYELASAVDYVDTLLGDPGIIVIEIRRNVSAPDWTVVWCE